MRVMVRAWDGSWLVAIYTYPARARGEPPWVEANRSAKSRGGEEPASLVPVFAFSLLIGWAEAPSAWVCDSGRDSRRGIMSYRT